jgi:hypothetical protein
MHVGRVTGVALFGEVRQHPCGTACSQAVRQLQRRCHYRPPRVGRVFPLPGTAAVPHRLVNAQYVGCGAAFSQMTPLLKKDRR